MTNTQRRQFVRLLKIVMTSWTMQKVKQIDGQLQKRQLDHCFVGSMLAPRVRSVWVDNDEGASDHDPIWIDIDLETPSAI